MTIAIALGLIPTSILIWWLLIEPILARFDRVNDLEDEIKFLKRCRSMDLQDNAKAFHALRDHQQQVDARLLFTEQAIHGHSFALRAERENSVDRDLISLNPHQRANTGH